MLESSTDVRPSPAIFYKEWKEALVARGKNVQKAIAENKFNVLKVNATSKILDIVKKYRDSNKDNKEQPCLVKAIYDDSRRLLFNSLEMDFWHFFEKYDPFAPKDIQISDVFLKDTWHKK